MICYNSWLCGWYNNALRSKVTGRLMRLKYWDFLYQILYHLIKLGEEMVEGDVGICFVFSLVSAFIWGEALGECVLWYSNLNFGVNNDDAGMFV